MPRRSAGLSVRLPFNRTIVELKYATQLVVGGLGSTFNRTIVELK